MSSHASAPVTASLLTILCVALVHRDRPDWLAVGVGDAARAAALSPERVSRLASRVAHPFADIVLPGTQVGTDTTDLSVFGVPLKLVGVQDIGGRDRRLFESVVIDTRECADLVVDALRVVLRDCPGIQTLTDQGTPYMAAATKLALDELQAEHAPQREGDPTGKSTVERGFGSLKDVLSPLLSLTDRLAELVPSLRSPDLAIPFARLLAGCALRAYQAGARATRRAVEATGNASEDTLVRAAARAREAARATDRSARLLLAHLHGLFLFSTSATRFVEQYRRYPMEVLRSAEASLRNRFLMRGAPDVRTVDRYFAALVRNHFDEHRRRRASRDASRSLQQRLRQQHHEADHAERSRSADPALWLRQALDLIAVQWLPSERHLLFDGHGLGVAWMRAALDLLLRRHGCNAGNDIAVGVLDQFRLACLHALGDDGIHAVAALLERELAQAHARHQADLAPNPACAIHRAIGLSTRSTPPSPLRN